MANYFDQLVAQGATGTDDPAAAGLDPNGAGTSPGYGGQTRAGFPYDEPLSTKLMRLWRGDATPPAPADAGLPFWQQPGFRRYDAPAINPPEAVSPSPLPTLPPQPPAQPPLSAGGASARVLAQLSGGPNYPAQDLGINLLPGGQQSGPYADLRARLAAAQPAAGGPAPTVRPMPAAAGGPAPPIGSQPAPAAAPILGNNISANAEEYRKSGLVGNLPVRTLAPDFYDRLARFGFAAMAAGGRPGATTLGALGEAGINTVDASQKARQQDLANEQKNRELGIHAQSPLLKAYEVLDRLQQQSLDRSMSIAAMQQTHQDTLELKALLAGGNQNLIQQKLDEIARHNAEMEASRSDANATAAAKQAETAARNSDTVFANHRKTLEAGMNGISLTDAQKDTVAMARTARTRPGSVYDETWRAGPRQDIIDDAKYKLSLPGANRNAIIGRLRMFGLSEADLK